MVEGVWQPMKNNLKHPDLIVLPSVFHKKLRGRITHVCKTEYKMFVPPIDH